MESVNVVQDKRFRVLDLGYGIPNILLGVCMLEELEKIRESMVDLEYPNKFNLCYMSFATFLELFKMDYNMFTFAGKWYLTNTDIPIEFRDNLPSKVKVLFWDGEYS